jgi:subtilisin family serine protease
MRMRVFLLVLVALVALPLTANTASAARTARILVHFGSHAGAARQKALIGRVGGHRVATVSRLGTAVVRVPAAEKMRALALLRRQPGVTYAETDGIVHAYALPINDPDSVSLPSSSPLWPLANPLFPDAWSLTTGSSSVVVAVVDTGVQADHPDLLGTVTPGYDFVNHGTSPADDEGHGTAVAGIIAAHANNGIGIAGVCWNCKIMPVKVLDASGSGTDADVAAGIVWAVDHGADVINLSLGGTETSQTLSDAVSYAERLGVVVAAAAGNSDNSTKNYPAAYSGVISVGAVKQDGTRYSEADWGVDGQGNPQGSNFGDWVMVDAPGCTNSTWLSNQYIAGPDLSNFCGTSAASPFVAGLAGLVRSYNLAATSSSVVGSIETTAQHLVSGNSAYGLIDSPAALGDVAAAPAGPVASFTASAVSGVAPAAIGFSNHSTGATSYSWSFGDGASSTTASPTHTFAAAGSFNVTLVATSGSNSRLANETVTVTVPPTLASFTASKSSGRAPLKLSFTNGSKNADSYNWSFGDSSSDSSVASPTHTFAKAGTYIVTLTVTGPGGAATASKTITVQAALPDLSLLLTRTASSLNRGERSSSFVARLRNRGGAGDRGVKITITLPPGSSVKSISTGGRRCTHTKRRLTCSIGTLPAGKTVKVRFAATVTTRASLKAAASGAATEVSLANNVARARTR